MPKAVLRFLRPTPKFESARLWRQVSRHLALATPRPCSPQAGAQARPQTTAPASSCVSRLVAEVRALLPRPAVTYGGGEKGGVGCAWKGMRDEGGGGRVCVEAWCRRGEVAGGSSRAPGFARGVDEQVDMNQRLFWHAPSPAPTLYPKP